MMHGIQISDCVDCVPNSTFHLYTNILLLLLTYKSLTLSMDKMSASYCAIQIGNRRAAYFTHSIAANVYAQHINGFFVCFEKKMFDIQPAAIVYFFHKYFILLEIKTLGRAGGGGGGKKRAMQRKFEPRFTYVL